MNIVLNTKDADSIIHWLREELEGINEYEEEIKTHFKSLCGLYNASEDVRNSEECTADLEETRIKFEERIEELKDDKNNLLHFIELLTCGSEVA